MKTNPILSLLILGGLLGMAPAAMAQNTAADEQAIRQLVDGQNAGQPYRYTDQSIFWSGAYARPQIGSPSASDRKMQLEEMAKHRANMKVKMKIERLTVAKSGDVAYEYGTFNLQFDSLPDKKHVDHDGAYLRTWTKEGGQWLIDVSFMRPFGDMQIVAEKK